MDVRAYNSLAWDREVEKGNRWTIPVGPEVIDRARQGQWEIVLTPTRPVPRDWFPPIKGARVLCLACGGGQQGPVLAAAGAEVTVLDNSPRQLQRDRDVAAREGLTIRIVQGDMADLSAFREGEFDLIFHPVSNTFVRDVPRVWREAFRVLQERGPLLSGFMNPAVYLFDWTLAGREKVLKIKYRLPYSDETDLPEEERRERMANREPLEFSHSLTDLIGGQIEAGFVLTHLFEDWCTGEDDLLKEYMPECIATRAVKPARHIG